jgi:hypothetical protein
MGLVLDHNLNFPAYVSCKHGHGLVKRLLHSTAFLALARDTS